MAIAIGPNGELTTDFVLIQQKSDRDRAQRLAELDAEYRRNQMEIFSELLATCKQYLRWLEIDRKAGRISADAARERRKVIRAAIAKAEGK